MKTIITLAITLALTFANDAFAIETYNGGKPQNHNKHVIFGFNTSGNAYGGYHSNHSHYNNHPHYGNPYYGHPNCGGGYPNNPYYGNGYPGNPYPNNTGYGNTYPGNNYPNYPVYGTPNTGNFVNENSFNGFINALDNEAFDNNKLKMAQFYASKTVLTVQQIGRILQQFTFDSNRLKFARTAYDNCYDKYNFVLLRNQFTFSSDFERLMNDIG